MLSKIQSVLIWSEDIQRLAPFYRDVLGLTPEMESDEFVMFQAASGAQLGLGRHSEVKGSAQDPYRVMVNFHVDDCQAEYEQLSKKGVKFTRKPSQDNGAVIATFKDPDGNMLQLFQMM